MSQRNFQPNAWYPIANAGEDDCLYLTDRRTKLELGVIVPDRRTFDTLMFRGYRRQGMFFYRPACPSCRDCLPIRIPLDAFEPSKSQRKLLKRYTPRFEVTVGRPRYEAHHFEIYARHSKQVSEANKPDDPRQYRSAFVQSLVNSYMIEYRLDGELACVSVLDEGEGTVSSVYTFWESWAAKASPGTFSALWEIDWARQRGRAHYHLGFWIRDCSQMSYKNRFRPYELRDWQTAEWERYDSD